MVLRSPGAVAGGRMQRYEVTVRRQQPPRFTGRRR